MPINLLIFAITHYRRDFRKYLMRAAERAGGRALHVRFREKVVFSWADAERVEYSTSANSYALAANHKGTTETWPDPGAHRTRRNKVGRARRQACGEFASRLI